MVEKWHKFVPAPRLIGVEPNPGPRHGEHLNEEQRWEVIHLWKIDKLGTRAIAKKMKIKRQNIQKLIQKYKETGGIATRAGQGRKRKLSQADVRRVRKKAKTGKSAKAIAREESKRRGESISRQTIGKELKESGLKYLVKQEREELTEVQIGKRVDFASRRMNYDWKKVFFTDEKSFWLGTEEKKAWQDPKDRPIRYKRRYTPKLHVWGGVGYYFKSRLYFFQQNLDGALYRTILNARIPPNCADDCPARLSGAWIFQQDGDPKHTARLTTALLDEIAPDRLRDHPPNSPDFNIMEDIWSYLDREIKKKKIRSIEHLKRSLTTAWNNLPWDYVRTSVESMPHRLQQCIDRGGERTDY